MSPPTQLPPLAAEIDRLRNGVEELRRKHFNAAEEHRLKRLAIDEHSDDGGDQEERRWHDDMAELHHDIAADLAELVCPPKIAVADLRAGQQLDIARLALSIIGRSSRDEEARGIADGALAKIGPPSMLVDEEIAF